VPPHCGGSLGVVCAPEHCEGRTEAPGEALRSAGLVEQVTTHTAPAGTPAQILRSLNKDRRLRRMRRCVIAHADATKEYVLQGGHRWYAAFVTLTYALVDGWRPEHITAYLNLLRNRCSRRGFKIHFEWVSELQERGAPHYHLLIWLPDGQQIPKPDASGMWTHGTTNIQRARKGVGYLVKYVSKGNNSAYSMPQGMRLFGTGGDAPARLARHRAGLPRWLLAQIPGTSRASRVPFVGWACAETGEVFVSPFAMRWGYDEAGNAVVEVIKRTEGEAAWSRSGSVITGS
jgi:hypothetical protein